MIFAPFFLVTSCSTLRKLKLLSKVYTQIKLELDSLQASEDSVIDTRTKSPLVLISRKLEESRCKMSGDLDDYISDCTAAQRTPVYRNMQKWLPLELRDMIHGFLLKDSRVEIRPDDIKSWGYPEKAYFVPQTFLNHAPFASGSEIFAHIHLADDATRKELTEAWYKFTSFSFTSNAFVPKFCAPKRWHLTTQPYSLICRVEGHWNVEFWYYCRAESLLGFRPNTQVTLVDVLQRPPNTEPFEGAGREIIVTEDFGRSEGAKRIIRKLLAAGYQVIYRLESRVNHDMIPSNPKA